MARVEWSVAAAEAVDSLVKTHNLPADTKARLKRSVQPLRRFPRLGPALREADGELRFIVGPWRWLLIVYLYSEQDDRVVIVSVEDGRASTAATVARSS